MNGPVQKHVVNRHLSIDDAGDVRTLYIHPWIFVVLSTTRCKDINELLIDISTGYAVEICFEFNCVGSAVCREVGRQN